MSMIDTTPARITNPANAGAVMRRPVAGDIVLEQVFDATGIWWRRWEFVSRDEAPVADWSLTTLRRPGAQSVTTVRGSYRTNRVMPVLAA